MRWIFGGKAVERGGAQGGTGSELAVTIPTFGGCPAPMTTQSDLALAGRPGPGDEFLQADAVDGARNQGVTDHEGRRSTDAERLG